MPQIFQSYVTQISNSFIKEQFAIEMLEQLSPLVAQMSIRALTGLSNGIKKAKLNTTLQQSFGVNKRYANSVINFVNGELFSAQSSYKRHIETLDAKIKSVKETINNLNKRFSRHREDAQAIEKQNKSIKSPQNAQSGEPKKMSLTRINQNLMMLVQSMVNNMVKLIYN